MMLRNIMGKTLLPRGLFNFVGDISKTLYGTLSQADLDQINDEFDRTYEDNKKLTEVVKNNTKIIRLMLDSSSQDVRGLNSRLMAENTFIKQLVGASNEGRRNVFLQEKIITLAYQKCVRTSL